MAILLEGCDGAPVMWGKIGGYIIQRTGGGTLYIKKYQKPSNPKTPAQQANRWVFGSGIRRWSTSEKHNHKGYWDDIAKKRGFRDGYRAFLSSYMMWYQKKLAELNHEGQALSWVEDSGNFLYYLESPAFQKSRKRSQELNTAVLRRYEMAGHTLKVHEARVYLESRGWWGKIRYGLVPKLGWDGEWVMRRLDLLLESG